jgi:hypothetical protein
VQAAEQAEDFPASNVHGILWSAKIPIRVGELLVVVAVTKSTVSRPTVSGFLQSSAAAAFEGQKSSLSELVSSLSFGYLSKDVAQTSNAPGVG